MASVWVIEEGSYSRYSVIGVFSTKEKADAILAEHQAIKGNAGFRWASDEGTCVVEWPLDPTYQELME